MIDFACKRFEIIEVIKCGLGLTKSDYKIMEYLIKNEDYHDSIKISKTLDIDLSTAQRSLKKLTLKNIILRSQTNLSSGGYIFKYKINEKRLIKKMILDIIHTWVKKFENEIQRW